MIKLVMKDIPYSFIGDGDEAVEAQAENERAGYVKDCAGTRARLTYKILRDSIQQSCTVEGRLAADTQDLWSKIGRKFDVMPPAVSLDATQAEFLARHLGRATFDADLGVNAVILREHIDELIQKFKSQPADRAA